MEARIGGVLSAIEASRSRVDGCTRSGRPEQGSPCRVSARGRGSGIAQPAASRVLSAYSPANVNVPPVSQNPQVTSRHPLTRCDDLHSTPHCTRGPRGNFSSCRAETSPVPAIFTFCVTVPGALNLTDHQDPRCTRRHCCHCCRRAVRAEYVLRDVGCRTPCPNDHAGSTESASNQGKSAHGSLGSTAGEERRAPRTLVHIPTSRMARDEWIRRFRTS